MKNLNDLKVYLERNKKELATIGIIVEETLTVTTVYTGEKTLLFFQDNMAVCEDGDILTAIFCIRIGINDLLHKTSASENVNLHNGIKAIIENKKSIQEKPLKVTMELVDNKIIDQNGNEYQDLGEGLVANNIYFIDYNGIMEDYLIDNGKLTVSQQGNSFRAKAGRHTAYGLSAEEVLSSLEYYISA